MDNDDLFSSELRGIRDRIAELQGRSRAAPGPGGGLLPEALEAERHRYQELFESAPVAYLVTDPLARIHEVNRAAAALLGMEQRFLAGKRLASCAPGRVPWGVLSV